VALFEVVRQGHLLGVTFPVPDISSLDVFACYLAIAGFVALWKYRLNVLWLVSGSALAGLLYRGLA
jgi:hypothetical protein